MSPLKTSKGNVLYFVLGPHLELIKEYPQLSARVGGKGATFRETFSQVLKISVMGKISDCGHVGICRMLVLDKAWKSWLFFFILPLQVLKSYKETIKHRPRRTQVMWWTKNLQENETI